MWRLSSESMCCISMLALPDVPFFWFARVNGYIFGCPLPIPGTCFCQLVSGVLGLANASLICVISGRCQTASPATVNAELGHCMQHHVGMIP